MKYWLAGLLALGWLQSFSFEAEAEGKKKGPSDAQIRQILIEESIAAYPGNCLCPYSTASNGSRCGRRSAYSREGGEAPLCYAKDVTGRWFGSGARRIRMSKGIHWITFRAARSRPANHPLPPCVPAVRAWIRGVRL